MTRCRTVLVVCGAAIWLVSGVAAQQRERLVHEPGAVLLQGYPEDDVLYLTRGGIELTLHPPGRARGGHHTYPSLSRDGTLVVTSFVAAPSPSYREGIAAYSASERQWRQFDVGDISYVWSAIVSPDGSRVAFKASYSGVWVDCKVSGRADKLELLDLRTGDRSVLIESFATSAPMSWSPDGRSFVYVVENAITIRDISSQQERAVVFGSDPSWSPSGEWIAYYDSTGALSVVHPDGTGATALVRLRRSFPWFYQRHFAPPAVWSPDSTALLLNESADDETARTLIHRFALESRKLIGLRGKGVRVLGSAQ